jgi:Mg-chelatase subunit ChlD
MVRSTRAVALALTMLAASALRASRADAAPATAPATAPAADAPVASRPQVEVVFVLDATGSMGGLIEGAKAKIWSIANAVIAQPGKPQVKIGLVAYRDRGDQFVTKLFDLTDDIDTVFKNLQSFQAQGGGDTPESVNQALNEAVTKVGWSEAKATTRVIFLVGDAPPHMDYADDVKYPDACAAAAKRDIVVNAVQCGNLAGTASVWAEIARLGNGRYLAVPQDGGMVAIAAPQDKELADLNAKLAGTVVAYGRRQQQEAVQIKIAANAAPRALAAATRPAEAALFAARAAFNAADGAKAIQGAGDLCWDCTNGIVKLADLKAADLPSELAKLSPDQLKAHVDEKLKERAGYQSKVDALVKEREAYVAGERARLARVKPADRFDEQVTTLVKEQVEAKRK